MEKTVRIPGFANLKIIISSYETTNYIDVDFYEFGDFVIGWCLPPDSVDELIQRLMQVKRDANRVY